MIKNIQIIPYDSNKSTNIPNRLEESISKQTNHRENELLNSNVYITKLDVNVYLNQQNLKVLETIAL